MTTQPCPKCGGLKWYAYDDMHSKPCEVCCKHSKGWWTLTEGYAGYEPGADNRCCRAGCGTLYRDLPEEKPSEEATD